METLKYTIIKTDTQYHSYCDTLEKFEHCTNKTKSIVDEIELLTLLIEQYDAAHNTFSEADPIALIKFLMKENKMKSIDLAHFLGVSGGLVSDMLHYKKGLSKETIRILAERFKLSQEAFNRPYKLKSAYNAHLRNASVMNTSKKVKLAR